MKGQKKTRRKEENPTHQCFGEEEMGGCTGEGSKKFVDLTATKEITEEIM